MSQPVHAKVDPKGDVSNAQTTITAISGRKLAWKFIQVLPLASFGIVFITI